MTSIEKVIHFSIFSLLLCGDAMSQTGVEGKSCFLSREYRAEVRDTASVSQRAGRTTIKFNTTYCNYVMSPDCSNAKSETLTVQGRRTGGVLHARSLDGACRIAVRFSGPQRIFVTQESECRAIEYWGPHGVYTLADSPNACN